MLGLDADPGARRGVQAGREAEVVDALDPVIDEGAQPRPVEVAGNGFHGLGLPEVAGCESIVGLAKDIDHDRFRVRDVDAAIVSKEAVFEG